MSNISEKHVAKQLNNNLGDAYIKHSNNFGGDNKKSNMAYWDALDNIADTTIKEIAKEAGIEIIDWGDYSLVKETVELITSGLKKRFNADFKYIDEEIKLPKKTRRFFD